MLDEKNYKVRIIGSFTGESAEKKTPYIGLELETECGNYIDWIAYLTDKTAKRNLQTLKDAGFRSKKLSDLSNPKMDMDQLFDHNPQLSITVEHEEWQNDAGETKKRAEVKWLNTGKFGPDKFDHKTSVKVLGNSKYSGMMSELMGDISTRSEKSDNSESQESEENNEDLPF